MVDARYSTVLMEHGFVRIGTLSYRLEAEQWWNTEGNVTVLIIALGPRTLLKAAKSYYLRSITAEGETWARDINALQEYLEVHFPECHITFSHHRDIPKELADRQARRKLAKDAPQRHIPSVQDLARLQRRAQEQRDQAASMKRLAGVFVTGDDLLVSHIREQEHSLGRDIRETDKQLDQALEHRHLLDSLQQEYLEKGHAATYAFSINTPIEVAANVEEFRNALDMAMKDLADQHRYQVSQKLFGGKLQVQIAEAKEPAIAWIEEWFGGALSPRQLKKLEPAFKELQETTLDRTMVIPSKDVCVDGHTRENGKRFAAHVVSSVAKHLDRTGRVAKSLNDLTTADMPITLGREMRGERVISSPLSLPLAKLDNVYISGATGAGKSYAGRVIVEEAAQYENLNILILDPRNQAVGLLAPEDRTTILDAYEDFGMERSQAHGYPFRYVAPGLGVGEIRAQNLAEFGRGRWILSFKGLDDSARCELFADTLDALFADHSVEEAGETRLLVCVEESQLFTKKQVDVTAKKSGERSERTLDTFVREIRKYGGCVVILSQTIRDFAYDSASIRQNTNTKVFLRNSDREVAYAADYIGDGRQVIRLATGTAFVHNAAWGAKKVRIRPPYSKVWEYSAADTRSMTAVDGKETPTLSESARDLLGAVREIVEASGRGPNLSEAGARSGISSRRALQEHIRELEFAGLVRTRKLRERGNPRIIEMITSTCSDKDRTNHGENGLEAGPKQ